MVLLVERLGRSLKFPSRLDNHLHNLEALSASLWAFKSDVSYLLRQLMLNSTPESGVLSLAWIEQCFEVLPMIHRAFAKLLVVMDYPMCKWGTAVVQEYLDHSLNLLELLNSVASSLNHVSQAKLSLFHALDLVGNSPSSAIRHLKTISKTDLGKKTEPEGRKENEELFSAGKDFVIHQALLVMKSIILWVLGLVLSGLCSDLRPFIELRMSASRFDDSLLKDLDSRVSKEITEKQGVIKEVKEVNDAVANLVGALDTGKVNDAAKELRRRLEILEKAIHRIETKADFLFAEVLVARNKSVEGLGRKCQGLN